MFCLFALIDVLFLAYTIYFSVTTLQREDCFSAECPQGIKEWLLGTFFNFYLLQVCTVTMFRTAEKDRPRAFTIFLLTTFLVIPWSLAFNIWGTVLAQRIDVNSACVYQGMAQSMQLLYLISTYCIIFIYLVFLITVRECVKRYHLAMEQNPAILRQAFNPRGFNVPLFKNRSQQDWCDAMAYTFWFLQNGQVGSRADRQYLDQERATRRFAKMSSILKCFKFEESGNSDEEELVSDAEGQSGLLNQSFTSRHTTATTSTTRTCSVTLRNDGSGTYSFKYKSCSICLADFGKGDQVKVVPGCGHTFHGTCLDQWLARKWRCPNCNVAIKDDSQGAANQRSSSSSSLVSQL